MDPRSTDPADANRPPCATAAPAVSFCVWMENAIGGVAFLFALVMLLVFLWDGGQAETAKVVEPAALTTGEAIGRLLILGPVYLAGLLAWFGGIVVTVAFAGAPRWLVSPMWPKTESDAMWGGWDAFKLIGVYVSATIVLAMAHVMPPGDPRFPILPRLALSALATGLGLLYAAGQLCIYPPKAEDRLCPPDGGILRLAGWACWAYLLWMPVYLTLAWCNLYLCRAVQAMLDMEAAQPSHPIIPLFTEAELSPLWRLLIIILVVVLAPVWEEWLFRGVLYGALRKHLGVTAAISLSGLIFGAVHGWMLALPLAVLGMWLAWWRERTQCLGVPILIHFLMNGVMLLAVQCGVWIGR